MKTKVDIYSELSALIGKNDTLEVCEGIQGKHTDVPLSGITVSLTRRRRADSLIHMLFAFAEGDASIFVELGNGGLGNHLNTQGVYALAQEGYAIAHCDIGTSRGQLSGYTYSAVKEDYGHEAASETYRLGIKFYECVYGKTPKFTYYWGGSTGGQMGMSLVLRHPEYFDGVIVGAPANMRVALHTYFIWSYVKLRSKDEYHLPLFTKAECEAVHRVAIEFHKERGRMLEGYPDTIASPVTADEDIDAFLCSLFDKIPFTSEQKSALYDVYHGPKNPDTGERIYRGFPIGSELCAMGLLDSALTESMMTHQYIFNWVWGDKYHPYTFDFARDYEHCRAILSPDVDADGGDLSPYLSRGGKLLFLAGTTDAIVPYGGALDYIARVRESTEDTSLENLRFFVLPTRDHATANASTGVVNANETGGSVLEAMRAWVEEGKAIDTLYTNAITEGGESVKVKTYPS